jgi:tetratricopeptide (TPR) repeat protein
MKGKNLVRSLVMSILLASFALGGPAAQAQEAAAPQASPFKDRAEYDAYDKILKAAQAKDNNGAVEAADAYLAAYPESKMLMQVYSIKLGAYQALNNSPKVEETANKILEIDPDNLRAILMLSYLFPRTVNTSDPDLSGKLDKAESTVTKGLEQLEKMQPAANQPPEQFETQRRQTGAILYETDGFVALQKKDYPKAAESLTKSLEANPNNALGFYWLGLAYLTPKPADGSPKATEEYDKGMYAMARSVSLGGSTPLPEALKTSTKDYLAQVYENRHGSRDGFDELLAQSAASPFPAADFHVMTAEELAPEPEPEPEPVPQRELTVKIEELATFDDIQAYLSAGGQKEADTWELLKGATLPLPGKVAAAARTGATTLMVAVSPALAATPGKHDVEVTLAEPLARNLAAGADVNFEGTLDAYTAKPFLLKMIDGKVN